MKKIAIYGFYGQGNLDDEAIPKAILQEFNKSSDIKVVVFSRNPKQISRTHGVSSIHSQRLLRFTKRLNVKTALCAIGVVNIRYDESRKLIQNALDKVDLITVRDRNLKDVLIDVGVTNEVKVVIDPVVLLANINAGKIKDISIPPKAIICVRHWFSKGGDIYAPYDNPKATSEAIKKVLKDTQKKRKTQERIKNLFLLQIREKELISHVSL